MKKFAKILCLILGFGFLLGGCASLGNISNPNQELIYNGNSAVMIDGYLYYANAFSDSSTFEKDSDYSNAAKIGYLARLNTNAELESDSINHSPKNVEKVSGEVVGYSGNLMFALGDYIYYTTPNKIKGVDEEGTAGNYFNYTSIYRSKLNGENKKRIYTTNGEVLQIEVLKYDGKYYIVMLAGNRLIKVQIGSSVSSSVIAENVLSVALPETYQENAVGSTLDWNGTIYYTTATVDEDNPNVSGNDVNKISISGGEATTIVSGEDITFIERERDVVFYTKDSSTYMADLSTDDSANSFRNAKLLFAGTALSVYAMATEERVVGYIFYNDSGKLLYAYTNNGKVLSGAISVSSEGTSIPTFNLLFVTGRTLYVSTTTSIYSVDLSKIFNGTDGVKTADATEIVTMTAIYDGFLYAYDGKYIYYYAQLEKLDSEEGETEEETDENYYLYRTKISKGNAVPDYELLGKAKLASRQS